MRELLLTSALSLCLTPVLLFCFLLVDVVYAQTVQSTSYRIISNSVNFGGGRSTSSTQSLESTGGEIATGGETSTNFSLKAGYQQMQDVFISMSGAASVTLAPSIPGISGGISNGSTTVTVTTDSPSGYSLSIAASQGPAMRSGANTIADYVPSGGNPDFSFITNPADAHLGYSPSGADIVSRYKDNGSSCNTGSGDTLLSCWDGLSTTTRIIASSPIANQPLGASTTVYFRVGVGGSIVLTPGFYVATTTLTALPQ